MAKTDPRLQDLSLTIAPAWFGTTAPVASEDGEAWGWLAADRSSAMEVSEFPVTEAFIEALFGARG